MLAVSVIVVPTVGWLVKEVLSLRRDFVRIQTQADDRHEALAEAMKKRDENCHRHQEWNEQNQRTLARLDRNIVRVCEKISVEFEGPAV